MTASEKLKYLLSYFNTNNNRLGTLINKRQSLYDIDKGKIKSFSIDLVMELKKVYPELNENFLLFDDENIVTSKDISNKKFLSHLQDPEPKINPTTKDALNNLKKIQAQKENIKPKNYDEGYYNEDDFVNTKRTVVTIKGFAGLQNAFFPDDYIDKHFTTEIVKVPKEDAGKHFYRIQVKENNYSMYPKIKPLDWTDCVEISKDEWNSPNIYKKDKVYCFWHPIKGILFKFAKLTNEDKIIELFSLNEDRIEYPNEKFNLLEFKKIMCVEYIIQKA